MSIGSLNILGCPLSMLSYKDGVATDILPTIQHSVQYTDGIQRSVQSAVIECCILRETDEEILRKFNGYYSQSLEVREALHETLEKIVPKIRQYL